MLTDRNQLCNQPDNFASLLPRGTVGMSTTLLKLLRAVGTMTVLFAGTRFLPPRCIF